MRAFHVQHVHRARAMVSFFSQVAREGKKHKVKPAMESKYSGTVFLPQTTFDQRSNAKEKEPVIQKWWADNRIYEQLSASNPGDKFILHDGPPYANGDLHIGHALNKILKDFINRYQMLRGRKVRYVPGWDCHGLPIELKVLQGMKTAEREQLTPVLLRKKAAEFAQATMEKQSAAFQRFGVWGDWAHPYLTMQPEYEAAQVHVFGQMVTKGHIYRGKKPVHWSPSSRTALAEAELEYPDNHTSRTVYAAFRATKLSPALEALAGGREVRVAVWTTTPWTLPANLAVAVNADLRYCLLSHPRIAQGAQLLVAEDLVARVAAKLGYEESMGALHVTSSVVGSQLLGTSYLHPFAGRTSDILIGGEYITTESGTGLVHTAPGHGAEDYATGLRHGLPLLSPVDDAGRFTEEAGQRLQGMSVLAEGNAEVIRMLQEAGGLLLEEAYAHKYPYDWRTKKPTIFRATEQWFASVSNFRQEALDAIDRTQWVPVAGRNRLAGMTAMRGDWCISRQRAWGVPIPVFYDKQRKPLMTPETLQHIEEVFRVRGSDAWWTLPLADLLPPGPLRDAADDYERGTDTMDVWFDSGTSWAGVLSREGLGFPADVYLEGSDQARGWFQSSLLTAVASQGEAPYKTVLTHGFVLDEKGYKMSKSLGNVLDPFTVIEGGGANQPAFGADTLRMWVSGVDYSADVCVGANIMKQVSESYRKLRNTMRYLLGALADFDPSVHAIPYESLPDIDKHTLGQLTAVLDEVEGAYDGYQFYRANKALLRYATDLSAVYLDLAKDRLYISEKDEARRRSCQTVLQVILEQLTVMMAPIVPHLAEEVWQALPYAKRSPSVFQAGWVTERYAAHQADRWRDVLSLRSDVFKCIELARVHKAVGTSMQCAVLLHAADPALRTLIQSLQGDDRILSVPKLTNTVDDLRFIMMASQVRLVDNEEELLSACPYQVLRTDSATGATVGVHVTTGRKCERCWYYCDSVGEHPVHNDLCQRCAGLVHGGASQ